MRLNIGICGGGIGGLAAAIASRAAGHDVEVYEQAPRFSGWAPTSILHPMRCVRWADWVLFRS
jgi:2-polyprenyl-6-methoxyphenol hydroxylase-like FAD-dependent oxidoreductase